MKHIWCLIMEQIQKGSREHNLGMTVFGGNLEAKKIRYSCIGNYNDLGSFEVFPNNQMSLSLWIHVLKAYFFIQKEKNEKSALSFKGEIAFSLVRKICFCPKHKLETLVFTIIFKLDMVYFIHFWPPFPHRMVHCATIGNVFEIIS